MKTKTPQRLKDRLTISVAEMAEYLGVSRPIAYKILNRADCRAGFKVGRRTVVSVERLREWIDKQTDTSISADPAA